MADEHLDIDQLLNALSIIMTELDARREKIVDDVDRQAVASQILAIGKLWRKLDAKRLAEPTKQLDEACAALRKVTAEVKKQRESLQNVAKVIHAAARTIAIAEKVLASVT